MIRCATAAVLAVLASAPFAPAADKAKKPAGEWTHTANDWTVTLSFEGDALVFELTKNDGESITVQTAYGVTHDGLLFGVITGVEKKGTDMGPEKGDLFSFNYKLEKDGLTLSDLNASKGKSDQASQLIEGEYKAKKK